MRLKLIGAICVFVGCGAFGFIMASQHRKRIRFLQNLIVALDCMACELRYRCTPLPLLCRISIHQNHGQVREIFTALADELESQILPDPEKCMSTVLDRLGYTDAISKEILTNLGSNLGRFDIEGQLRGLEMTRSSCSTHLDGLLKNKDNRLRSYQTLGLCAGAAIAILFV